MHADDRKPVFRAVSVVFGVALVAAAVLKAWAPGGEAASPVTAALPRGLAGLVPLFELALGVWLVSGVARFGAWAVATPTAAAFALHSFALTAADQPSCGCLGELTVPPMLTLAFDVIVLAMLVRSRPAWAGWPAGPAAQGVAVAGVLLGLAVAAATAHYGSLTAALAAARGESAAVTPETLALGPVPAGATVERSLRVANLSADALQIALGESNCGCVAVRGLPVSIAPGGWADVPVAVTVSGTPGPFRKTARLRTSAGDLTYAVTATVAAGPRDPGTPPGPDAREVRP